MNVSMVSRMVAAAAVVVAITGVAVVATAGTKPAGYTACANAHHTLGLSVHGKCAKHFHKVTVGAATVPGLGTVYVKTGTNDLSATAETLSLPAGRFSLDWQAVITGTLSHAGAPAGQEYDLELGCEPQSDAGGTKTEGPIAEDESALTPDAFISGSSRFDFHRALDSVWVLTVPAGGAKVDVVCGPPNLTDGDGNSATAGSASESWQIEATKVAVVAGSDTLHESTTG